MVLFMTNKAFANETQCNSFNRDIPQLQHVDDNDEDDKLSEKDVTKIIIELLNSYKEKLMSTVNIDEVLSVGADMKKDIDVLFSKYSVQLNAIMTENKPQLKKMKQEITSIIEGLSKVAEKKTKDLIKGTF